MNFNGIQFPFPKATFDPAFVDWRSPVPLSSISAWLSKGWPCFYLKGTPL